MGKDKKPAALSLADAALARQTARLIGEQMRYALWEHRMIQTGKVQEMTLDAVRDLRDSL